MLRITETAMECRLKYGGWWTLASRNQSTKLYQIYTWRNQHTGEETSWAMGKIVHIIEARSPPQDTERKAVTKESVARMMQDGGLEDAQIRHLIDLRTRPGLRRLEEPGIIVRYPDGSEIIADGVHRFVARGVIGIEWMDFHIVTSKEARAAEMDLTDEDRATLSRIHEMAKLFNIPRS